MGTQVSYMHTKDLGYNKENFIVMRNLPLSFIPQYLAFKNELLSFSGIKNVSAAIGEPSLKVLEGGFLTREGNSNDRQNRYPISMLAVDANFIEFMKMQLAVGKNFSPGLVTETPTEYILNETAVKTMGWETPNEALNKLVRINNFKKGPIIGVIKDFNYSSLHQKVDPLALFVKKNWFFCLLIKIQPDHIPATISFIEKKWSQFVPSYPFEYVFLQDLFDRLYGKEEKQYQILGIFSILAILISCLGIFGLISLSTAQRTREIAIRKTLGGSIAQMIFLLTKEIMILIAISFVIAVPLAYIITSQWLQKFANRIEMNGWIFLLAGLGVLLIALLTASAWFIKAAMMNPIDALREE
jgi:putative ABC transport system permease protein